MLKIPAFGNTQTVSRNLYTMSYKTINLIVKVENDEDSLKNYLQENFKFFNIKTFHQPFLGIVCQANEYWKEYPFEKFPDNYFANQNEVENYFEEKTEEKISKLSIDFPNKQIAMIRVDCFGGKCTSDGYIIKNGEEIFEQSPHHSAHQILLKRIYPNYNSWFFYPFTRTFFSDKGGINGEIANFSLPAIWMSFNMDLGSNPEFEINVSENELQILNQNKFELYFMSLGRERIKAMGRLFSNEIDNINFIKKLLTENLEGIEHYFEIDDFETGNKYVVANFSEEKFNQISSISYRENSFNVRPYEFSEKVDNSKQTKTQIIQNNNEGFWTRLMKTIFGK